MFETNWKQFVNNNFSGYTQSLLVQFREAPIKKYDFKPTSIIIQKKNVNYLCIVKVLRLHRYTRNEGRFRYNHKSFSFRLLRPRGTKWEAICFNILIFTGQ